MRVFPLLFASSCLWGITDGQIWVGRFEKTNITLNGGDNINVILDRDSSISTNRGNNFGKNGGTTLTLSSNGGNASLTLTKNISLTNLQFYHNRGNTIQVNQNATLTIDLRSHTAQDNRFNLAGGLIQVNQGGNFILKGIYRLSIGSEGGGLEVNQGGELEVVWAREVKNIAKYGQRDGIINNGGTLTLKTEVGVFNSDLTTDGSSASSYDAGVITHNSGTTIIRHREENKESLLFNSGFRGDIFGTSKAKYRHALLNINGGEFKVVGTLYNGGGNGGSGGAGVGWIVGRGGVLNVTNTLINTSKDNTLPSKISLYNTTIKTATLQNKENGEIYLKDQAKIQATTFTSEANSSVHFIGKDYGFGLIVADSIALGGKVEFELESLKRVPHLKYLIATSPTLTGLTTGAINLKDPNGMMTNRYKAEIQKEQNNYYIKLSPTISYTSNYVSNTYAIQRELDSQMIILTQETLDSTTQTILSQIEQTQSLKSITTYSTSNLYNRTTQAQIIRPAPRLAFNPYTHTQSDFLPTPLLERSTPYSFFINFIGGAFGYEGSVGGNYGANFGIDGFVSENLFLGGYSVILGKSLESEGVKIQGLQAEIGGYARAILSSWEFDTTLSYTLLHNSTQRAFSLYGQTFSQEASYNTNFFNLEERVGYRFALTPSDTLKPYAGVGLHLYYQPSYSESGDFTYSQNSLFFGSFALLAGLEYRKVFSSSSLYLGATLGYSIPSFGDTTYSMHFLDSLLVFKHSPIFTAQIQGGAEFAITPTSYLSVELNYKYNDTRYFDADGILGYRYLF